MDSKWRKSSQAPCKRTQHCWPKISQHCWMLHVTSVCTPCCILLGVKAQSLKLVKRTQHCCIRLHVGLAIAIAKLQTENERNEYKIMQKILLDESNISVLRNIRSPYLKLCWQIVPELFRFVNYYKRLLNLAFARYEELCSSWRVFSAKPDNTLLDLHNSSYHVKAESNNCYNCSLNNNNNNNKL